MHSNASEQRFRSESEEQSWWESHRDTSLHVPTASRRVNTAKQMSLEIGGSIRPPDSAIGPLSFNWLWEEVRLSCDYPANLHYDSVLISTAWMKMERHRCSMRGRHRDQTVAFYREFCSASILRQITLTGSPKRKRSNCQSPSEKRKYHTYLCLIVRLVRIIIWCGHWLSIHCSSFITL